ncbi:TPA: glycosyltransferase family 2 protein [Klebsiella quasipneumoniae subsp. similipneumoniae]|nr:glycosyltransferase family 2 protein [Klebsiella quasipneumoniae subsp. similipneumoniae]
MNPRFTIGIPAYKASFLRECIDSILSQTFKDFELIIVNDASPENLDSIISSYDDTRIRYYKNDKNCGAENVIDNWNKCLSFANGDYFILMGDDDKVDEDYLSEFNKIITANPEMNVYHCRSLIINEKSVPTTLTQKLPSHESIIENMWHRLHGFRNQFISDFVYKKQFLDDNNGFYKNKLAWASDDITSYIAMTEKGIVHTNSPLLHYRRSTINITSSGSVQLKLKAVLNEYAWYQSFLENYKPQTTTDIVLFDEIKSKLNKFKKKKIIETISYSGIRKGSFLKDVLHWARERNKYNLSLQEYIYLCILAYKKIKASEYF